jgi:hypothetical protein
LSWQAERKISLSVINFPPQLPEIRKTAELDRHFSSPFETLQNQDFRAA